VQRVAFQMPEVTSPDNDVGWWTQSSYFFCRLPSANFMAVLSASEAFTFTSGSTPVCLHNRGIVAQVEDDRVGVI
jgi:hypothetical protein